MSHHPPTRPPACIATGLPIAAVALIAIDRVAPVEPALEVASLWLGGRAGVLVSPISPAIARA